MVNTAKIRSLDVHHDLAETADLIELCFRGQMDEDGKIYLRNIRKAARHQHLIRWINGAGERTSYPLFGYVWEENGRIIGNISLIPVRHNSEWRYLIANVAVHPSHRRRGIGKQLTEKGIEHAREHGASLVCLQVRESTPGAHQLYLSTGFKEVARRTTWLCEPPIAPLAEEQPELSPSERTAADWKQQSAWLQSTYPSQVSWNLPINSHRYAPFIWRHFLNLVNGHQLYHWAVRIQEQLAGTATWEPSLQYADNLWLAVNPARETQAIPSLLLQARRSLSSARPLAVNYPARRAEQAFQKAGFEHLNTLIWMEKRLKPKIHG